MILDENMEINRQTLFLPVPTSGMYIATELCQSFTPLIYPTSTAVYSLVDLVT